MFKNCTPKDFESDKLHSLKYLYIFRRKQEITLELLSQCDLTDPEDFKAKKPFARASQQIQQETGMNDADLSEAIRIGMWIDEYDRMIHMTPIELQDYIAEIEDEPDSYKVPDILQEDLTELWDNIQKVIDDKHSGNLLFEEIINENFNDKEEWPNGFSPYS